MAKRRKLPEEDLAAAVADILSSPITRANLSFLAPLPPRPPDFGAEPVGSSVKPTESVVSETPDAVGSDIIPMGIAHKPMESAAEPTGFFSYTIAPSSAPDLSSFWQAEGAPETLFPPARVHRIERAADALSSAEERVYRLLWQSGAAAPDPDTPARLAQLSLQRIATQASLNIRTVRLLLPRLIEKGFAEVAAEADVRRNLPTTYRLWSEDVLVERLASQGRRHVVKTGRGVFFACPFGQQQPPPGATEPVGFTLKPIALGPQPMDTVLNPMGFELDLTDSLAQLCRAAFQTEPDRATLEAMVAACRRRAVQSTGTPATAAEILYFTRLRADVIGHSANIRNHLAVLARSVPECFTGPVLLAHRAESRAAARANTSGI